MYARLEAVTISDELAEEYKEKPSKFKNKLQANQAQGDSKSPAMEQACDVKESTFKEALTASFTKVLLQSKSGTPPYIVEVKYLLEKPDRKAMVTTFNMSATYKIIDCSNNTPVVNKTIKTTHSVKFGDNMYGPSRYLEAMEVATRKNIEEFIKYLHSQ